MENKFTDNEIMKALGCCCVSECDECPYDEQTACVEILKEGTLALINRQKAMIDGLIAGKETLQKALCDKNAEIERLQRQLQEGIDLSDTALKIVKSEARKELAEKVKPILREMFDLMMDDYEGKCIVENCKKHSSIPCMNEYCIKENREIWETKIDNLVKEMESET